MKQSTEKITIIGAGLCGSLLALRMAQKGYDVTVFESRPDLRTTDIAAGRSINLALSDRGLKALRLAGVEAEVRPLCIPMYGRLVHDKEGNTFDASYSGREGEFINSISRTGLNGVLLSAAEAYDNVRIHFNKKCISINTDEASAEFECLETGEKITANGDVLFGTDGAGSVLRKTYYTDKKFLFSFSQNFLTHGYKELEIPADANRKHQISKDHLHIWPRGAYMLIALPNLDGSFTVTLFLSYDEGTYHFNNLTTEAAVTHFFETEFPDALQLIPNIKDEFFNNPTGPLGTVKCSPWYYQGKSLILGDAAHAIVPFYGQGMNASFEDVTVFMEVLEATQGDWETTFKTYQKRRKQDTDAIADLAVDNYYEMRDHVANPLFKIKRQWEMVLEQQFPKRYFSKYSMVTFNESIPYHTALIKGRAQDKILLNMIANKELTSPEALTTEELEAVIAKIEKATEALLKSNDIAALSI